MLKTVIPFGPQHPVLPEPLHLKLTVEDEIIQEVIPALGFIHRGLEAVIARRDFHQMIQSAPAYLYECKLGRDKKTVHKNQ